MLITALATSSVDRPRCCNKYAFSNKNTFQKRIQTDYTVHHKIVVFKVISSLSI